MNERPFSIGRKRRDVKGPAPSRWLPSAGVNLALVSVTAPLAYLGLGSNMGDRSLHLASALLSLERSGFVPQAHSSFYWTEPVGGPPQEWFLNAVVAGAWPGDPRQLLMACLDAEAREGRVRGVRFGPRTLDVDVLLFGERIMEEPDLVVPHPRLHERRFVLAPLDEIAPDAVHPLLGLTVGEMLRRCADGSSVRKLTDAPALAS